MISRTKLCTTLSLQGTFLIVVREEKLVKPTEGYPRSDQNTFLDGRDLSSKPKKAHQRLGEDAPVAAEEDQEDIPKEVVAATMDVGRKLMGALDPHNMLQVQRWRRKKKGGKKQRKSYVKGKVIDGRHELYTLSIAVMLGVRTSIARTNTIISSSDGSGKKILSPQDFMAEEKYEFAPKVRIRCQLYGSVKFYFVNGTLTYTLVYICYVLLIRDRQQLLPTNYRIRSNLKTTLLWPSRTFEECLV